jgi:hypothetical protein
MWLVKLNPSKLTNELYFALGQKVQNPGASCWWLFGLKSKRGKSTQTKIKML